MSSKKKHTMREIEMYELAKIIQEFRWIPDRKIPLLITFEELNESSISALENAKVNVCEVMPELKMVYAEITPKKRILQKLLDIKQIKRISISREVEMHDCREP